MTSRRGLTTEDTESTDEEMLKKQDRFFNKLFERKKGLFF
jgi:hypothetical protein